MDTMLRSRMERLLALTSSTNEHEAFLAAEKLQELLTRHNLDVADLETRGQKAPSVQEKAHDLGKAAFTWKLDLADTIADHFYCYPLVDRKTKTVRFVGRPDNVLSLTSLYQWIIDQIRAISKQERYKWMEENHEHIDPLRFQVQFGIGIVERLGDRLSEIKRRQVEDNQTHALVVHHRSEVSDYLEEQFGYRVDGQDTKATREYKEKQEARKKFKEECMNNGDMEPYYAQYPWERPLTPEQQAKSDKRMKELEKKWAKADARRARYQYRSRPHKEMSDEDYRKERQSYAAREAGRNAAEQINLQPFLKSGATTDSVRGELE